MENKPLFQKKEKGITVSLWQRPTGRAVSIQKQWHDKASGQWKKTDTYFENEAYKLIEMIQEVLSFNESANDVGLNEQREEAREIKSISFDEDDVPF